MLTDEQVGFKKDKDFRGTVFKNVGSIFLKDLSTLTNENAQNSELWDSEEEEVLPIRFGEFRFSADSGYSMGLREDPENPESNILEKVIVDKFGYLGADALIGRVFAEGDADRLLKVVYENDAFRLTPGGLTFDYGYDWVENNGTYAGTEENVYKVNVKNSLLTATNNSGVMTITGGLTLFSSSQSQSRSNVNKIIFNGLSGSAFSAINPSDPNTVQVNFTGYNGSGGSLIEDEDPTLLNPLKLGLSKEFTDTRVISSIGAVTFEQLMVLKETSLNSLSEDISFSASGIFHHENADFSDVLVGDTFYVNSANGGFIGIVTSISDIVNNNITVQPINEQEIYDSINNKLLGLATRGYFQAGNNISVDYYVVRYTLSDDGQDFTRTFTDKGEARLATTGNITLSGLQTIDSVVGDADDIILVHQQSDATENGIYLMKSGSWVRVTNFDSNGEIVLDSYVVVSEGEVNGGKKFVFVNSSFTTLDSDDIDFEEFAGPFNFSGFPYRFLIKFDSEIISDKSFFITHPLFSTVTETSITCVPIGKSTSSDIYIGVSTTEGVDEDLSDGADITYDAFSSTSDSAITGIKVDLSSYFYSQINIESSVPICFNSDVSIEGNFTASNYTFFTKNNTSYVKTHQNFNLLLGPGYHFNVFGPPLNSYSDVPALIYRMPNYEPPPGHVLGAGQGSDPKLLEWRAVTLGSGGLTGINVNGEGNLTGLVSLTLWAGDNVSFDFNDTAKSLTINAAGGESGIVANTNHFLINLGQINLKPTGVLFQPNAGSTGFNLSSGTTTVDGDNVLNNGSMAYKSNNNKYGFSSESDSGKYQQRAYYSKNALRHFQADIDVNKTQVAFVAYGSSLTPSNTVVFAAENNSYPVTLCPATAFSSKGYANAFVIDVATYGIKINKASNRAILVENSKYGIHIDPKTVSDGLEHSGGNAHAFFRPRTRVASGGTTLFASDFTDGAILATKESNGRVLLWMKQLVSGSAFWCNILYSTGDASYQLSVIRVSD